jgi:cation-transporting P-type ATPase 13A2
LPDSFDKSVERAAKSGVYQIAIAIKDFDLASSLADVRRDDVETNLSFLGFINFRNVMRVDGDVPTAMITGDNVVTGICIAREAGMIKENTAVVLGRKVGLTEIEWVDVDSDEGAKTPSATSLAESGIDLAMTGEAWGILRATDPKYASALP